jgi:hypothetical protein
MDKDLALKYGTGEARALLAEAWFTFLGFVAATAVVHAVAARTSAMPVLVVKWFSYAMLWGWLSYKVDQLIWSHFPGVDPLKKKATPAQLAFSVFTSFMLTMGAYWLVVVVMNALIEAGAV